MNARSAIEQAVRQALGDDTHIQSIDALSGGCIHQASRITLASGQQLVVKIAEGKRSAAIFHEEADGLDALLRTGCVIAPQPIAVIEREGIAALLMNYIEPARATNRAWQRLGSELAALHAANAGSRYGWRSANHLGSTLQPNGWMDDWVKFNRVHRLGHQVTLARSRGLLEMREVADLERLMSRLEEFIPRGPKPALLHGDLWSGNALPTTGDRIAIIDPAVYVGDGWADIAMMRLFGGFPEPTYNEYAAAAVTEGGIEERIIVYQIYHLLNHVNIFGRGYAGQTMAMVSRLL